MPQRPHRHPTLGVADVVHNALVGDMLLDRCTVEVSYIQAEKAGVLQEPVLSVLYGPDWGMHKTLNIPLAAAGALGDIIALLTVQTFAEFGAALARGSKGPGEAKAVTW
ncbi:hypothetical protein ACFQBS_12535 [Planomonospora parontospora]|uniref:hypothetical protein n=1 Tax=Planomonospora parontospora TaxID=58119 RepID=UPI00361585C3